MLRETGAISFVFRVDAGSEMSLDFFWTGTGTCGESKTSARCGRNRARVVGGEGEY